MRLKLSPKRPKAEFFFFAEVSWKRKSPCVFFSFLFIMIFLFPLQREVLALPKFLKYPFAKGSYFLGDHYYRKENYAFAQIEYERSLASPRRKQKQKSLLKTKLALSLLRQEKFIESTELLEVGGDFSQLYLSMFSALRLGWLSLALRQQGRILASPKISAQEKEEALLLGGTVYLERGEYEKTRRFYSDLQKKSKHKDVRYRSGRLLSDLESYESQPQKKAWLAGTFSAILPGSGQFYAKHYTDGLIAFFFNVTFLGSALLLYDLENKTEKDHYASAAMGLIGLNFYLANVIGGTQSARRYNNFQERKFHQEVRNSFFNIDRVEKITKVYTPSSEE